MLIFDATPLIYLAKAETIGELAELEQEKLIPEKVYQEVVVEGRKNGEPDAEWIAQLVDKGVFDTETVENNQIDRSTEFLSQADISVLELTKTKDGTAIMDEEYGRNIAEVENIETHGTAFLVLRLLKKDVISSEEAQNTIDSMIDEGWYCSTDLYKEIVNKIEELGY